MNLRVSGSGYGALGLGFGFRGFGFQVSGFRFRFKGSGCEVHTGPAGDSEIGVRVPRFGFRVSGCEFWVSGLGPRAQGMECILALLDLAHVH